MRRWGTEKIHIVVHDMRINSCVINGFCGIQPDGSQSSSSQEAMLSEVFSYLDEDTMVSGTDRWQQKCAKGRHK